LARLDGYTSLTSYLESAEQAPISPHTIDVEFHNMWTVACNAISLGWSIIDCVCRSNMVFQTITGVQGTVKLCWQTADTAGLEADLTKKYGSNISFDAAEDGQSCAAKGGLKPKFLAKGAYNTTRFNM
jgi:hypothetical protein